MASQDSEYWFSCRNVAGGPARGAVLVRDGELVVVLPQPGSASFEDVEQVQVLCAVLAVGDLRAQRERRSAASER